MGYIAFRVLGVDRIFIQDATETDSGLLSATDKIKLDNLVPGTGCVITWNFGTPWSTIYPLIQAAQSVANSGGVIVLLNGSSSNVSPFPIDASFPSVNFDGVTWFGTPDTGLSFISVASGVQLGGRHTLQSFSIRWKFLGNFYTGTDPIFLTSYRGAYSISGLTGSNAAFILTGNNTSSIYCFDTGLQGDTVRGLINVGDGTNPTTLQIREFGGGNNLNLQNTIKAPNAGTNAIVNISYDDSNQPSSNFATGSQLTLNLSPVAKATGIPYTATTVANWSNVNPTSVGDALDRIAAKIGPIP